MAKAKNNTESSNGKNSKGNAKTQVIEKPKKPNFKIVNRRKKKGGFTRIKQGDDMLSVISRVGVRTSANSRPYVSATPVTNIFSKEEIERERVKTVLFLLEERTMEHVNRSVGKNWNDEQRASAAALLFRLIRGSNGNAVQVAPEVYDVVITKLAFSAWFNRTMLAGTQPAIAANSKRYAKEYERAQSLGKKPSRTN